MGVWTVFGCCVVFCCLGFGGVGFWVFGAGWDFMLKNHRKKNHRNNEKSQKTIGINPKTIGKSTLKRTYIYIFRAYGVVLMHLAFVYMFSDVLTAIWNVFSW